MQARDIPNIITVARILMVPPIIWLLLQGRYGAALVLFGVAGVSDGVDGYLAKRFDWGSRLGAILDPLADKLLLISCYVVLAWQELIPFWIAVLVLGRDVVILGGAATYHFLFGRVEMEPRIGSKINTFFQIVLVLAVVLQQIFPVLPNWSLQALVVTVLCTTIWSGADYVSVWTRRALQAGRRDRGD